MEPCAPGTEDEPAIMYSSLKKQENEQQRILRLKAVLKNGKYDNIFELSYVNGAEHWFCNACQCPVMGRVYQHELGKRHSQNIQSSTNQHSENRKDGAAAEEPISLDIAPGEPVPPGFEGEVGRVSQIQERLDGFKVGPLVGLEYLLELQDYDLSKEPVYLCILCDKKGDPRTVLTHLASYNHISQYLQKHFVTCYRALAPYMTKQYKRNWQMTLQKVAEAIEKKFGRLRPYPIEKDKFEKERLSHLKTVSKGPHFSETTGWTFEELIVHDELTKTYEDEKSYETTTTNNWGASTFIQKPFKKRSPSPPIVACPSKRTKGNAQTNPKSQVPAFSHGGSSGLSSVSAAPSQNKNRRRSLDSVSSISSNDDLSDIQADKNNTIPTHKSQIGGKQEVRGGRGTGEGQLEKRKSFTRNNHSPPRRNYSPRRHNSPPKRNSSPLTRTSMPWQNPNYQRQKNEFAEKKITEQQRETLRKIEEFRKLARTAENDMHRNLKFLKKNPEKHPCYNDEWKKFWNKRYKELQTEGVDVSKHDFKPEWIQFWNKRMIELHNEELLTKKNELRKKLGLPEEPNPVKFKIGTSPPTPKENKPNLPMAAEPDEDNEVIIIDDKDEDRKSPIRSHSPWEKDVPYKSKHRSRSSSRSRKRSRSRERQMPAKRSISRERQMPAKRSISRERQMAAKRSISRERQMPAKRSIDKSPMRRSMERSKVITVRSLSRGRSPSREMSRSKDYRDSRDKRSRSRERSPSREMSQLKHRDSRDKRSRSRERRSRSRERNFDRRKTDMRIEYRESSYERDRRGKDRIRTVADLPWEREKLYRSSPYEDYYKPPSMMRDVTRKPVMFPSKGQVPIDDHDDDAVVNIVDVLRILTALEESLGSLGPKVIDLLAQALAMEKKDANSSETLIDNDINCVLFETVKEKLKGQLLAGLVDIKQERAFKKAIKKTASLIHMAGQRKRQWERLIPKVKPVTVPGVGTVDKAAIAKQIATALIMQGKTDVTQNELEQLINAVVGMAEASKNSNKPITTAGFLEQLASGTISLDTGKEPKEKIIIPTSAKKAEIVELEELTEPLTPSPGKSSASNMENLSDSDLQTLLQNFKDLSTDEQHNLITYLKKLEYNEPERVERLRKFVSLDPSKPHEEEKQESNEETKSPKKPESGRESPFSNRPGSLNPMLDENVTNIESEEEDVDQMNTESEKKIEENEKPASKVHVDSEDEDYTFEDVVKSVSKTVKDKELENNMKIVEESMKFESNKRSDTNLSDAKSLISNLMSNFSKNNSSSGGVDLLGLGGSSKPSTAASSLATSTADFAKTLSSINMDNLASIVSNVQKMTDSNKKTLNFEPPPQVKPNPPKLNFDPSQLLLRPESPKFGGFGTTKDEKPFSRTSNNMASFDMRLVGPGRIPDKDSAAASVPSGAERMGPVEHMRGPAVGSGRGDRGPLYGSVGPNLGPGRDFSPGNEFGSGGPIRSERDFRALRDFVPERDFMQGRDIRRDLGPGRDSGPDGDFGPGSLGPGRDFGPRRDLGPGRELGPARDLIPGRDPGRNINLGRDLGSERDFGPTIDHGSGRDFNPGRNINLGRDLDLERDFGPTRDHSSGRDTNAGRSINLRRDLDLDRNFGPTRDYGTGRDLNPGRNNLEREFDSGRDFGPTRDNGSGRDFNPGTNINLGRDLDSERDFGPTRDHGSGRDFGFGRDLGSARGFDSGRHLGPVRDFGPERGTGKDMVPGGSNMLPSFGSMDRSAMQYQRNPEPFAGNNFPSQQNQQYPNLRDSRPDGFDQRNRPDDNARFGNNFSGNQFNSRMTDSGNFKRW